MNTEGRFVALDTEEAQEVMSHDSSNRRGRVSYPILKGFLESGMDVAKLNREGLNHPAMHYHTLLKMYIEGHNMPVALKLLNGELYLIRKEYAEQNEETNDEQKEAPKLTKAALAKA
ncbi:hypothetical protein LCGC14_0577460 [marine sediment metagenome]|uniref:Uncharacterized protein n=1 Tax=marine sediment metagenome TaxID=412755 RepID=A0A0F9UQN0_9ZZZZ